MSHGRKLAHIKWLCKYHIVFAPKYRRKIIYHKLREDIKDIIKNVCKRKGVEIIEGYMMHDCGRVGIIRIYVKVFFGFKALENTFY